MPYTPEAASNNPQNLKDVYDISVPLNRAPIYPGDRPFSREWMARLDGGDGYNLSALSLGSHAGTHLDFPAHLLKGGRGQDEYPPGSFIMPAEVVCVPGDGPVMPGSLPELGIESGQALLFKTGNFRRNLMHQAGFSEDFISLSEQAARLCVARRVKLVGIDYLSVDEYGDDSLPVHRTLLENDILILEGIDLEAVPCGRYTLICLPLRIEGAEASPVRAVLVRRQEMLNRC
ncbi:MAG TPA: cyclase family protein [Methanothrix soehngenii]|jgi:arylformamidase|nr:cyclase family protein [Methanothrix soehngenii]